MNPTKNTARYCSLFDRNLARFSNKLASYINDPNVDNIHQVRTSYRRLEANYSFFPSSIKTQKSDNLLKLGKIFFRLNSVVRDSDIILQKLKNQSESGPIIDYLHQLRAENLERAMKVAQQLAKMPEFRLHQRKEGLDHHFRHKVKHRINNILHFVPLVKDDEENGEELHAMRKQAKKLFYLLELDNDPDGSQDMQSLKDIQTSAGEIHDCDVTLAFLQDHRELLENAEELTSAIQQQRHDEYVKLLSRLDNDLWRRLGHLA